MLEIPDIIRRRYFGTFEFFSSAGIVVPVVAMDCEIAVSSIIQAELPVSAAPLDALAVQAIASRSLLCSATARHHNIADFCDTTHCQFLRSPAAAGSKAAHAVNVTSELVLFERDRILPARYSAACGGITEAGLDGDYQYISVSCEVCGREHTSRRGHGWGLCQEGAIGLARLGWSWASILAKYYPNTTVASKMFANF
jgi:peptidoglycan hydrolase-like amidase